MGPPSSGIVFGTVLDVGEVVGEHWHHVIGREPVQTALYDSDLYIKTHRVRVRVNPLD